MAVTHIAPSLDPFPADASDMQRSRRTSTLASSQLTPCLRHLPPAMTMHRLCNKSESHHLKKKMLPQFGPTQPSSSSSSSSSSRCSPVSSSWLGLGTSGSGFGGFGLRVVAGDVRGNREGALGGGGPAVVAGCWRGGGSHRPRAVGLWRRRGCAELVQELVVVGGGGSGGGRRS
jgi:hypothetical protein